MKNTPGHPDQESPRATSQSLRSNKDSEVELHNGNSRSMFDCEGNLILPKWTSELFDEEAKHLSRHKSAGIGIIVSCPKCGYKWERMSETGKARCSSCRKQFYLEDLK